MLRTVSSPPSFFGVGYRNQAAKPRAGLREAVCARLGLRPDAPNSEVFAALDVVTRHRRAAAAEDALYKAAWGN